MMIGKQLNTILEQLEANHVQVSHHWLFKDLHSMVHLEPLPLSKNVKAFALSLGLEHCAQSAKPF